MILLICFNGECLVLYCWGVFDVLFVSEVEFDVVFDCCFLYYGGIGLLVVMDQGQSVWLLQVVKVCGVIISFDFIVLNEEIFELLWFLLLLVDYFMFLLEEVVFFFGEMQLEVIGYFFLVFGVGICILKDGENGFWFIGCDGGLQYIVLWLVEVVDIIGCGDSYCGGFIVVLVCGFSVKVVCDVVLVVVVLVVIGMGLDVGGVDWEQIQVFMVVYCF